MDAAGEDKESRRGKQQRRDSLAALVSSGVFSLRKSWWETKSTDEEGKTKPAEPDVSSMQGLKPLSSSTGSLLVKPRDTAVPDQLSKPSSSEVAPNGNAAAASSKGEESFWGKLVKKQSASPEGIGRRQELLGSIRADEVEDAPPALGQLACDCENDQSMQAPSSNPRLLQTVIPERSRPSRPTVSDGGHEPAGIQLFQPAQSFVAMEVQGLGTAQLVTNDDLLNKSNTDSPSKAVEEVIEELLLDVCTTLVPVSGPVAAEPTPENSFPSILPQHRPCKLRKEPAIVNCNAQAAHLFAPTDDQDQPADLLTSPRAHNANEVRSPSPAPFAYSSASSNSPIGLLNAESVAETSRSTEKLPSPDVPAVEGVDRSDDQWSSLTGQDVARNQRTNSCEVDKSLTEHGADNVDSAPSSTLLPAQDGTAAISAHVHVQGLDSGDFLDTSCPTPEYFNRLVEYGQRAMNNQVLHSQPCQSSRSPLAAIASPLEISALGAAPAPVYSPSGGLFRSLQPISLNDLDDSFDFELQDVPPLESTPSPVSKAKRRSSASPFVRESIPLFVRGSFEITGGLDEQSLDDIAPKHHHNRTRNMASTLGTLAEDTAACFDPPVLTPLEVKAVPNNGNGRVSPPIATSKASPILPSSLQRAATGLRNPGVILRSNGATPGAHSALKSAVMKSTPERQMATPTAQLSLLPIDLAVNLPLVDSSPFLDDFSDGGDYAGETERVLQFLSSTPEHLGKTTMPSPVLPNSAASYNSNPGSEAFSPSAVHILQMQVGMLVQKVADMEGTLAKFTKENEELKDQVRTYEFEKAAYKADDEFERQGRLYAEEELNTWKLKMAEVEVELENSRELHNAELQTWEQEKSALMKELASVKAATAEQLQLAATERDAANKNWEEASKKLLAVEMENARLQQSNAAAHQKLAESEHRRASENEKLNKKLMAAVEKLTSVETDKAKAVQQYQEECKKWKLKYDSEKERHRLQQHEAMKKVAESDLQVKQLMQAVEQSKKENAELMQMCHELLLKAEKR